MLLEDLGGDAFAFLNQAEQDVLGADVVVVQLKRLAQRELEDLLRPRGERDMAADGAVPVPTMAVTSCRGLPATSRRR